MLGVQAKNVLFKGIIILKSNDLAFTRSRRSTGDIMGLILYTWVIASVFILPLPFIFLLKKGRCNTVYKIGLVTLIVGKVIEAALNFAPPSLWNLMYVSDPIMMVGSIMLFVGLNDFKVACSAKARYGTLFCGIVLIATFMYGTAFNIYGVSDWSYPAVSIVYYTCFWAIALSYLEIADYHPLSFVGAFFVIISILICFSYDGGLFSGALTLEEYAAAPWYFSYSTQSIAGIFAFLGALTRGGLKEK